MATHKILFIDDSIVIRMMFRDMFPPGNFEVMEAKDGQEGLHLIYKEKFNLIMLDWIMPRLSGWEVLQKIKADPLIRNIPLVVMSGRREEVTEKIPEPFDSFEFLEKPFDREVLISALKSAFAKANIPWVLTSQNSENLDINNTQPSACDLSLGNNIYAADKAVLGGIEGIKIRLESVDIMEEKLKILLESFKYGQNGFDFVSLELKNYAEELRIKALSEALNYDKMGLEYVINALYDKSDRIQQAAFWLLWDRTDKGVSQALINFLANKR